MVCWSQPNQTKLPKQTRRKQTVMKNKSNKMGEAATSEEEEPDG